jgi:GNAT superfamily N-acetyltransferase
MRTAPVRILIEAFLPDRVRPDPPSRSTAWHDADMSAGEITLRHATVHDRSEVLALWSALFEEDGAPATDSWPAHAGTWFSESVIEPDVTTLPVVEVAGRIVATAVGSLTIGVPNPWCPRGRTARLENVYTRPSHRGRGFGTMLVRDIVSWARRIEADRVDLSTTPLGRRIYEKAGFVVTAAPRMKLML